MAYVNQEKKAKIAAQLKTFMPKDWKYSLAVRHHSTIVMTIRKAPVDLLQYTDGYKDLNHFHLENYNFPPELMMLFKCIVKALNTDNFDKSDIMTDYFHVGHYVDLNIGSFDKPFQVAA